MNKIKILLVFIFFNQFSISQESPFYVTYNWEEKPNYNVDINNEEEIIAVKHKIITEFFFQKIVR